jgi:hypothetical protein
VSVTPLPVTGYENAGYDAAEGGAEGGEGTGDVSQTAPRCAIAPVTLPGRRLGRGGRRSHGRR